MYRNNIEVRYKKCYMSQVMIIACGVMRNHKGKDNVIYVYYLN